VCEQATCGACGHAGTNPTNGQFCCSAAPLCAGSGCCDPTSDKCIGNGGACEAANTVCNGGSCAACGANGQPCCNGGTCSGSLNCSGNPLHCH
jgi:hypothetical protein